MPVLKTKIGTEWVPLVAGRDGAQGEPGPASPHEGSNIAVGVRQYGAVGDGTTDDTAAVQAAINAAGSYGFVDFEAGTYKVTSALSSWLNIRKTGPGVLTDGALQQYVTPRYYGDFYTLHVDATSGNDNADGMFPHSAFKTLGRLNDAFERMDSPQLDRGRIRVLLSGVFTEGVKFQDLPITGLPILFEGEALDGSSLPVTTIRKGTASNIGIHVEPSIGRYAEFRRLKFEGFNGSSGFGFLWSEGGTVDVEDCWADDCGVGMATRNNVTFFFDRPRATNCTISGLRSQYAASATIRDAYVQYCFEGIHCSRNAVTRIEQPTLLDNERDGVWTDHATRTAIQGPGTIHRNGREGVRAEGAADVHVYGGIDLGTGTADANLRRGIGLYGFARTTGDHSIYGVAEMMLDSYRGTRTTAWTADRGLYADRVGLGARIRTVVVGQGAGTVQLRIGAGEFASVTVPAGDWRIEMVATHDGAGWQGRTTIGASTTVHTLAQGKVDSVVTVTPTGATVREIEAWTGG